MACLALLANGDGYSDVYEEVGLWLFALLLKIHGLREVKKDRFTILQMRKLKFTIAEISS